MKAVWVDALNELDFAKAEEHRLTAAYFALTGDPAQLHRNMLDARNAGHAVGLYAAWNWPEYSNLDSYQFAEAVDNKIGQFIKYPRPSWPKVQFDIEAHDPDYILETLSWWRKWRPTTDTSWTLESFQSGWMSPSFVQEIIALKVRIVPQFYSGVMADISLRESDPAAFWKQIADEQVAQDAALRDLTRAGFPESLVSGFWDAAALPRNWDGFAFTQGRLP